MISQTLDSTAEYNTVMSVKEQMYYDDSYTVSELKGIAKEKGISGYSTMTKLELLEVLNNA